MKDFLIDERNEKKNRKIISIDIVDKKTFQPGLRTRKEKPRLVERGKSWLRKNLDDEELGQNKVLYSSSEVKLPIVKLLLQAPRHSLHQGDRSPTTRRLLALEPHWLGFYFVTSFLSLYLACHFLACLVGHPRFCSAKSWVVGLAMGRMESRDADVTVDFSGWSLWKMLTIFQRCITVKKGS